MGASQRHERFKGRQLELIYYPELSQRGWGCGAPKKGGQFKGRWEEHIFDKHVCHDVQRQWDTEKNWNKGPC